MLFRSSPSIEQAASKGAGPALVVFKKVASAFDGPTREIEGLGTEYASELVKIDPAVLSMIRMAELSEPDGDSRELLAPRWIVWVAFVVVV